MEKKKAKRGFFLHVADKNALHPREKAELAGRVLQRAQTRNRHDNVTSEVRIAVESHSSQEQRGWGVGGGHAAQA